MSNWHPNPILTHLLLGGLIWALLAAVPIIGVRAQEKPRINFTMDHPRPSPKTAETIQWETLQTRHTVLKYQNPKDLDQFNRSVSFSAKNSGLGGSFFGGKDSLQELPQKIDALYQRVQEILDMRKQMKPVTIFIHPDRESLCKIYRFMFATACQVRAWYLFEENAIYVTVEDVNEGMLAHELAHAIVDNYLQVRPPRATAEILARYVDGHLNY